MDIVIRTVEIVLSYGLIIALFWAFYDATRFTVDEFRATGKFGRTPWLLMLGGAIVLDFWLGGFRFSDPIGGRSLAWLATALVLGVYLKDMRPRLTQQRLSGP